MKKCGRLFCILLALLLLPCSALAAETAPPGGTVRLGYYGYSNFMEENENGDLVGFTFEYFQEVRRNTGWSVEYVNCGSWENALSKLLAGEIDMLPVVHETPARTEQMLFPSLPMCYISTALYTRSDDQRLAYDDFAAFHGMRVAMIEASKNSEHFLNYAAQNGFTVQPIYYKNSGDAMAALDRGVVDTLAITYLGRGRDYRCVAQFNADPVYLAVSNMRPDLLEQLDQALYTMKLRNPDFESQLYAKYFSASTEQKPVFTRAELDFIQNSPVITAVYNENWPPLEYTNPDTGAFSGVVADLFAQISEDTGLTFQFVPVERVQEGLTLALSPGVDLICAVGGGYLSGDENRLSVTRNYLKAPVARISMGGNRDLRRIAVLNGYLNDQLSSAHNQEESVIYYDTAEACLDALLEGQVDGVYLNSYLADYMLAMPRYENLTLVTLTDYSVEAGIGVSETADPRLFSVLDKCIQYMAAEQVNQMILKNALSGAALTWSDLVRQNPGAVLGAAAVVFTLPLLLLSYLLLVKSKSKREIESLLYHDSLTGLWNLNKFRLAAEERLKECRAGDHAILYLDIKQFGAINDTQGFAEGDAILRALGRILTDAIGEGECCARVSADQFVLLLGYDQWKALEDRCAAIGCALVDWGERGGKNYRLVLAFGVYIVDEAEGGDLSLMMDLANYARRSILGAHKSQVILYDAAMRQTTLYQRELADCMQSALENQEFVVYFQPKVDMETGGLIGSEALVRWEFPGRGTLPPGEFISYFESNGFVLELDFYVFERVCRALRRWMDQGRRAYPVSCNFSPLHTADFSFSQRLQTIADQYGVPHELLELEVTEGVFMRNLDDFSRHFYLLKGMGFPISIDDFGSGYSSLGLLQKFAVDVVKLDRSFIQEGIHSSREQAVLRGILNMAAELGVSIICEGVETLDQALTLRQLGGRYAQGFYYARPMGELDFEALLTEPEAVTSTSDL